MLNFSFAPRLVPLKNVDTSDFLSFSSSIFILGLKPGFFISLDLLPVVSFNYRGYDLLLFSFPDVSV